MKALGSGKGWTQVRGRFVVVFDRKHMGSYMTAIEAEARYRELVRLRQHERECCLVPGSLVHRRNLKAETV